MLELNKIYNTDCIGEQGMCLIPDKSIDMILCDLPYGLTSCKWDSVIPFDLLWQQYERIIKDNGAIVLFGSQPFTSALIMSNPKIFRYEWIWNKTRGTNFANANKMPMKSHENIIVFYKKLPIYNPQFWFSTPYKTKGGKRANEIEGLTGNKPNQSFGSNIAGKIRSDSSSEDGRRFPLSIIEFIRDSKKIHPTQKPVALLEYLIKTYTNEGETVLDNCIGSGSTAIACINTNRNFIGFELNKDYYDIANKRIKDALDKKKNVIT